MARRAPVDTTLEDVMKNLLAAIGCALVTLLAGCASAPGGGAPPVGVTKVVRVAVAPSSPPMLFVEGGRTVGADLEIFQGYCAARGCRLEVQAHDWQGMLAAVAGGRADVAFSGISITAERRKTMDFSAPYYDNAWHLVSLAGREIRLPDLTSLKRYTIGYPRGMAYDELIRNELEPKGLYALPMVKLYPTYEEVVADLRRGAIDLAFIEEPVLANFKVRRKLPLESRYAFKGFDRLGFAFPKGSPMRADFDLYLVELGPTKLQAILDKWML